jgi:hypothetical protein
LGVKRIRKRIAKPIVESIDDFFADEIGIVENGVTRRVSNFEAIILQVWLKAMAGNRRAMNVLLKYGEFAASRGGMGGLEVERIIEDTKPEEPGGEND